MTNKEGHYKLWDELARTGSNNKEETFERLFPKIKYSKHGGSYCFACIESGSYEDCYECPIDWGVDEYDNEEPCAVSGTLFDLWMRAKDIDIRKYLAAIIRDLPWKEKDQC